MNLKDIKRQLEDTERCLNMNFEETIKDCLETAEVISYSPGEVRSKEELQRKMVKNIVNNYDDYRAWLIERATRLQKELDKAQSLQHVLNMLREADIVETPKSVVNKQIRKNYIMIEKHYKVNKDEYNVLDWLADADPENSLGFL